jgi:CheY-like chemotaxis protein
MTSNMRILLVEDDLVDVMTVRRAFAEIRMTNPLDVADDGEAALEFLQDGKKERPGLILLDLNTPRMNGIELLHALKQDPTLRSIPVVVLTTSKHEEDKIASFALSVAGYMIKPVDYRQFVEVIRTINMYWTLSEVA